VSSRRRPLAGGTAKRRAEIGRERRERTRKLLLTAAARVVAARGTEGISIEDFIKAAGVARGTFYNYFSTREQLISALWQHLGDTPLRLIRTAHGRDPDPAYRLTSGLRQAIRRAAADPVWGWLLYRITLADVVLNQEMRAYPMADIQEGIRCGRFDVTDAELACDYFVGVAMMAIKAVLIEERPADYPEQCTVLVLRGLGLGLDEARAVANRNLPPPLVNARPRTKSRTPESD
jgi:AcrR family transcriptional regulator